MLLPSGKDAVVGGIGPDIIGEGLYGWMSLGIGGAEDSSGTGPGDPDAPGIDGTGVDCPGVDGADPPVAVNSDSIFSLRVVLSSV